MFHWKFDRLCVKARVRMRARLIFVCKLLSASQSIHFAAAIFFLWFQKISVDAWGEALTKSSKNLRRKKAVSIAELPPSLPTPPPPVIEYKSIYFIVEWFRKMPEISDEIKKTERLRKVINKLINKFKLLKLTSSSSSSKMTLLTYFCFTIIVFIIIISPMIECERSWARDHFSPHITPGWRQ